MSATATNSEKIVKPVNSSEFYNSRRFVGVADSGTPIERAKRACSCNETEVFKALGRLLAVR